MDRVGATNLLVGKRLYPFLVSICIYIYIHTQSWRLGDSSAIGIVRTNSEILCCAIVNSQLAQARPKYKKILKMFFRRQIENSVDILCEQ